jgi:hypothetical protein
MARAWVAAGATAFLAAPSSAALIYSETGVVNAGGFGGGAIAPRSLAGVGRYLAILTSSRAPERFDGEVTITNTFLWSCLIGSPLEVPCGGNSFVDVFAWQRLTPRRYALRFDHYDYADPLFTPEQLAAGFGIRISAGNVRGTSLTYNFQEREAGLRYTLALYSVPEPTTWGMLILGFGAIGLSARRKLAGSGTLTARCASS